MSSMIDPVRQEEESAEGPEQLERESRRQAIARLGKYAVYTAPALLAMLTGEARAQGDSTKALRRR